MNRFLVTSVLPRTVLLYISNSALLFLNALPALLRNCDETGIPTRLCSPSSSVIYTDRSSFPFSSRMVFIATVAAVPPPNTGVPASVRSLPITNCPTNTNAKHAVVKAIMDTHTVFHCLLSSAKSIILPIPTISSVMMIPAIGRIPDTS